MGYDLQGLSVGRCHELQDLLPVGSCLSILGSNRELRIASGTPQALPVQNVKPSLEGANTLPKVEEHPGAPHTLSPDSERVSSFTIDLPVILPSNKASQGRKTSKNSGLNLSLEPSSHLIFLQQWKLRNVCFSFRITNGAPPSSTSIEDPKKIRQQRHGIGNLTVLTVLRPALNQNRPKQGPQQSPNRSSASVAARN